MFLSKITRLSRGTLGIQILKEGKSNSTSTPLSWGEVPILLRDSAEFRNTFINILQQDSKEFDAVFFETNPVSKATQYQRPFEFILKDCQYFQNQHPDQYSFQEHFTEATISTGVSVFTNLGGNVHF